MEPISLPPALPPALSRAASPPTDPPAALMPEGTAQPMAEPSAPLSVSLAMPDLGALAYMLFATTAEYMAQCEEPGASVLRQRVREARIPAAAQEALVHYPDTVNFLALVGAGLPDTPSLLPLWMRIAHAMPRADLRVVDEHSLPLLERLLSEDDDVDLDAIDLPMLIVLDEEWRYQGRWGPRPAAAEALLDAWLAQHPEYEALAELDDAESNGVAVSGGGDTGSAPSDWATLTQMLVLQMRVWYNSGLDADAANEILALLASLQDAPADAQ